MRQFVYIIALDQGPGEPISFAHAFVTVAEGPDPEGAAYSAGFLAVKHRTRREERMNDYVVELDGDPPQVPKRYPRILRFPDGTDQTPHYQQPRCRTLVTDPEPYRCPDYYTSDLHVVSECAVCEPNKESL